MDPKNNKKYKTIALYAFITVCAAVLLCVGLLKAGQISRFFGTVKEVIAPITYAFLIAYLCCPLVNFLERTVFAFKKAKKDRPKLRRSLSIALTYVVVSAAITAFLILLVPQIVTSYEDLTGKFSGYIVSAQIWADGFVRDFSLFNGKYEDLNEFLNVNKISEHIQSLLSGSYGLLKSISDYAISYAGKIVVEVKNVVLAVVLAVYFLFSKEKLASQFKKLLASFLPRRHYLNTVNLARYTHEAFGGFITGKLLDALIIGLLTFIATGICGIPYYPLISLVICICDVIPIFGPIIGAIPTGFIVLIAKPEKLILYIIIIIVLEQLEGNIISPKIVGERTGVAAMWVMIAIVIFGGFFVITGMVCGVPAFAVIYTLVKQQAEKRLKRKNAPEDTAFYFEDPPRIDFEKDGIIIGKKDGIEVEYPTPEDVTVTGIVVKGESKTDGTETEEIGSSKGRDKVPANGGVKTEAKKKEK